VLKSCLNSAREISIRGGYVTLEELTVYALALLVFILITYFVFGVYRKREKEAVEKAKVEIKNAGPIKKQVGPTKTQAIALIVLGSFYSLFMFARSGALTSLDRTIIAIVAGNLYGLVLVAIWFVIAKVFSK